MSAGDYDREVLDEGGYKVELSNRGDKRHENPCPTNLSKERIRCKYPGCGNTTTAILGFCPNHNKSKFRKEFKHTRDWLGRIIPPGYNREQCRTDALPHALITEILVKWMNQDKETRAKTMDAFIDDILESVASKIPDATSLQDSMTSTLKGVMTPDGLVELVKSLVDKHFPRERYGDVKVDGEYHKDGTIKSLKDTPIRIMAATLVLALACEESNRGDAWYYVKHNLDVDKSSRASAYMASVYYLLRRHTKATEKQARMSLKG